MRRARLGESSRGKHRQDCKSYIAMERDRGWVYRGVRGGAPLSIPKEILAQKSLEQKVILKRKALLKNCPGEACCEC